MSRGRDLSSFLPSVIKSISSSNLEIRRLVYAVLLKYAEKEPDVALLSINSFQVG